MADADLKDVFQLLEGAQNTEHDNRERMREADHFLNKRDGQWEPDIISRFSGKPRYTFDESNPLVDDIMGEMEAMDFDIDVKPAGGESSKDIANAYEGIIRNIENISGARFIYNAAARCMVGTGMSAWRVVSDYRDDDSFQQDLLIRSIPTVQDSVWFDPGAGEQDMSDAKFCFVMSSMTKRDFEKLYPKGKGVSVGSDIRDHVYYYKKPDEIIIGEYLYKKKHNRELALLSNGRVVEVNDEFEMIRDELTARKIEVVKTRKRPYYVVYQRLFDGADWLKDEQETPFCHIPIVPAFGNFKISENKVIYSGVVERIMDPQRVLNYAESRKIEEGALAPRGKTWMPKEQATSPDVRRTLRTLNTNMDPVQFYDHVDGLPPPQYMGAPQSNPGLMEVSMSAQNYIQRISGTFDEARGAAPPQRSGIAIEKLQQKSDNPKRKWFTAMEIALAHTCRILIKAIPKVYDTMQEMAILGRDGTADTITINEKVYDEDSRQWIELNDLSKGSYNVVCSAGPAFQSRQQETVAAITEIASVNPEIMQLGADIMLNNISSPGIDDIAERMRLKMFNAGMIPPSQMTEEEKQIQQQKSSQPPPPDAMMVAAQAEMAKAKAKEQEIALKSQFEQQKLKLQEMEMTIKAQLEADKIEQQQEKQMAEIIQGMSRQVREQAEALKAIREAMGADAVIDPSTAGAYKAQADQLEQTAINQ